VHQLFEAFLALFTLPSLLALSSQLEQEVRLADIIANAQ